MSPGPGHRVARRRLDSRAGHRTPARPGPRSGRRPSARRPRTADTRGPDHRLRRDRSGGHGPWAGPPEEAPRRPDRLGHTRPLRRSPGRTEAPQPRCPRRGRAVVPQGTRRCRQGVGPPRTARRTGPLRAARRRLPPCRISLPESLGEQPEDPPLRTGAAGLADRRNGRSIGRQRGEGVAGTDRRRRRAAGRQPPAPGFGLRRGGRGAVAEVTDFDRSPCPRVGRGPVLAGRHEERQGDSHAAGDLDAARPHVAPGTQGGAVVRDRAGPFPAASVPTGGIGTDVDIAGLRR